MRTPLPIDALREPLESAWTRHRNFILRAPTGSGKSTRVPQFLLDWKGFPEDRTVVILQPRRMAARLLARRVAAERGEALGQTVGYRVRFDSSESPQTRLLFVTEGLLLRMLQRPESLKGIGALLFDEFHERHLEGDVGLGLAIERQRQGWGGRIGIFSATLETAGLQGYVPEVEVLESEGRQYPVEVEHLGFEAGVPVWERAAAGFKRLVREGMEADLLIFMPGKYEIRRTVEAVAGLPEAKGWEVCPLHGDLDASTQDRVVSPGLNPRVIVATNIAETSLTLPGIRTVIDSGLARIPDFDARRGVNTLLTEKISRASAEQRAGRAGRLAPGKCLRLWGRSDHEHRPAYTSPEVERLDLSETRLQLTALDKESDFPWLQAPPRESWERAGALLEDLGAVRGGTITVTGREMARYPLHPRFSRILLAGKELGCLEWVMAAIALQEERSLILPLGDKRKARERELWWASAEGSSDLLREVLVWRRGVEMGARMEFCREWGLHAQSIRQAGRVFEQLRRLAGAERPGQMATREAFGKAILTGYVDHLSKRLDRGTLRCEMVHGRRGEMRRETIIGEAPLFVPAEAEERELRGEATLLLGALTAVEESWLEELYPEELLSGTVERMDLQRRRVEKVEQVVFRGLVLRQKEGGEPRPEAASQLLARFIHDNGWVLKKWDAEAETWIRRVNVLAETCPELEIKPLLEEDRMFLIEQICEGATAYKEVKDRPVMPLLHSWLPDALLPLLDEWAPTHFALPDGKRIKLRYEPDGTVVLAARIQQVYDLPGETLVICQRRKRLRLELLAPNGRPVQITDDLDGFWKGQYPQIRKDLFGRYPKHEWR